MFRYVKILAVVTLLSAFGIQAYAQSSEEVLPLKGDYATVSDIHHHLNISLNSSNEADYFSSLTQMKSHGELALKSLHDAYFQVPKNQYFERWLCVNTAGHLEHPSFIVFAQQILAQAIPAETSSNTHYFSTLEEEMMIRLSAINGLERLAKKGNGTAASVLFYTAKDHREHAVAREAALSYISASDNRKMAQTLLQIYLPAYRQSFLEVKRGNIAALAKQNKLKWMKTKKPASPPPTIPFNWAGGG